MTRFLLYIASLIENSFVEKVLLMNCVKAIVEFPCKWALMTIQLPSMIISLNEKE